MTDDTGERAAGWRLILLPIRRLAEMGIPARNAYNEGLRASQQEDYHFALRLFHVAERKYRRRRSATSEEVLAAMAGQAYCLLKIGRYVQAGQIAQRVLDQLGERTAVRGVKREAIERYRDMAASAYAAEGSGP